ncbi:MAG: hypothetical protein HC767_10750 [Akkermansiaceae bacterium]|nr:hypothetical protein [Akkermansiaceae bacterium]
MKLVFPMGWTISNIAWAMVDGKQVLQKGRFDNNDNWHWARKTLEHGLDFLLACSFDDGEFVAQVRAAAASPPSV